MSPLLAKRFRASAVIPGLVVEVGDLHEGQVQALRLLVLMLAVVGAVLADVGEDGVVREGEVTQTVIVLPVGLTGIGDVEIQRTLHLYVYIYANNH